MTLECHMTECIEGAGGGGTPNDLPIDWNDYVKYFNIVTKFMAKRVIVLLLLLAIRF